MRQLRTRRLTRLRLHRQRHQMRRTARQARRIQSAHGQHAADDGILVALGQIDTADDDLVHEQARVRVVLARVGEFPLGEGDVHPLRLDDGDEQVADGVVAGEVDGGGDEVGEGGEGREGGGRAVDGGFAAVVVDGLGELDGDIVVSEVS